MVHIMTSGNSKQPSLKPKPGLWKNLLLLVIASLVSLWVADRVFIAYEQSQLIPKLPDIDGEGPVNLSALRYNDGVVERKKGPDEFRILSFGDSFTYSVMDPQWSYNGVIQQQLQAAQPQRSFRVVNLGEPATGTRHFREAHDFWSQVFEHDAGLFHIFLGNDILDDAYIHASIVWVPNEAVFRGDNPALEAGNPRVPQKFPLRMMDYAYAWWMSSRTHSGDLPEGYNWAALTSFDVETFNRINFKYMENFDPGKMPDLLAGYEQVAELLKRAQEVSETGKKVMVVLGPAEAQVDNVLRTEALASSHVDAAQYDLGLAQRIIARLQERLAPDVSLLDLSWEFRRVREEAGEKLFFRRNTHWDKAGNRLAGEVIAREIAADWWGVGNTAEPLPEWVYTPRVSAEEIDAYIARLAGGPDANLPVITGAVRAIQMIDGITGQANNWAIAPLDKEVLIEFPAPKFLTSMQLDLYDVDGRTYRFTVEAKSNEQWELVADYSAEEIGGSVSISLNRVVSGIRLIGLHNSAQENNPANAFLHIEEVSFTAGDNCEPAITIDEDYVENRLGDLTRESDLSKFIL